MVLRTGSHVFMYQSGNIQQKMSFNINRHESHGPRAFKSQTRQAAAEILCGWRNHVTQATELFLVEHHVAIEWPPAACIWKKPLACQLLYAVHDANHACQIEFPASLRDDWAACDLALTSRATGVLM